MTGLTVLHRLQLASQTGAQSTPLEREFNELIDQLEEHALRTGTREFIYFGDLSNELRARLEKEGCTTTFMCCRRDRDAIKISW